jgi:2-polyprenyl-3-methyl-5-hydroxy-6-metoxy-1,4-benzoquinol methylase
MTSDGQNLWSRDEWEAYHGLPREPLKRRDPTRLFLERYLPAVTKGRCLEIGHYPGLYLGFMAEQGFAVNGIDWVDGAEDVVGARLTELGHRVEKVLKADFFAVEPVPEFDLVYSLGFLEHFTNWEEVLLRHAAWTKPGGYMIITCPNFRGALQRSIRTLLDRENLARHYIPSMNPNAWASILKGAGDMDVVFAGHFGGYRMWLEARELNVVQTALSKTLTRVAPVLRRLVPENNAQLSAFCGLVARKRL